MDLIERAGFLASLQTKFENVAEGEGHSVFISGEAGIGKTLLVKTFCREKKDDCKIYQGTCDALFAPRPLAPLYDIALQMGNNFMQNSGDIADRSALFTRFFHELSKQKEPTLLVFEDIHWADEATLDFIKFLARRITGIHCLFLLTYRDEEIHSRHPVKNIMGQLPADSFTRLQLAPLSRQAVEKIAAEKGYKGEDVYGISGGNPFYVNEILASYSPGIPENIKDSILSVYNRQDENTRRIWEILSVLPTGFETSRLEKMEPSYSTAIENSLGSKILIVKDKLIFFKHELYRRTIEASLSPLVRVSLNKRILDLFLENFEQHNETERIIHHAKNANEYDLVVRYAPLAARKAASMGAHIEASKLYFSAIEYYQGNDKDLLLQFYEPYSYECYLTNRIKEAIIYQGRALNLWKAKNNIEKTGNCMRFLSRLWWYEGNHTQAESYATQAVETLENQPSSRAKAMAFSNMSQLKMCSGLTAECLSWGEKTIAIAQGLEDQEVLSHVLNNIGTIQIWIPSSRQKGIDLLLQSLDIALKNAYHEHAARAYTNLICCGMDIKDYVFAEKTLKAGIHYCEERNLDALISCLISCKARWNLETGNWTEALDIAERLIKNENLVPIAKIEALVVAAKIKMRRGDAGAVPMLLEAMPKAFGMMELEYMIPVMTGLLEYEWINGERVIEEKALEQIMDMVGHMGNIFKNSEFAYWLLKARNQRAPLKKFYEGYQVPDKKAAGTAAALWEKLGCPYEQALILFEGNEIDKRKAIGIVHKLGAHTVYEKMKLQMRASGIKSIPRGIRKTTQSNAAFLTERELGVLQLLQEGMQNKEIAARLFISAKTVDHHISSILFKLDVNSRAKAVQGAIHQGILKQA